MPRQAKQHTDARETCSGSGSLASKATMLEDPFAKARKAKKPIPKNTSVKVACPTCGRRVGTRTRKTGEHAGELTIESHWTPRPRAKKEDEVAEAV